MFTQQNIDNLQTLLKYVESGTLPIPLNMGVFLDHLTLRRKNTYHTNLHNYIKEVHEKKENNAAYGCLIGNCIYIDEFNTQLSEVQDTTLEFFEEIPENLFGIGPLKNLEQEQKWLAYLGEDQVPKSIYNYLFHYDIPNDDDHAQRIRNVLTFISQNYAKEIHTPRRRSISSMYSRIRLLFTGRRSRR